MKKVIPRNTTIPVRRSDIFSTSENNQTSVEVHVLQGEREMAADNKSLGRFKLMGIPPAPRGVPQVLVSFDIDANGILQVSAMDKTTGREQSLTVQGASNLDESEVQRMIEEAEEYAETDRLQRERVEKRNRAEALTFQAERLLREVALDFGMQFARDRRRRIEGLVQELRDYLEQGDERGLDIAQAELQDELYDLNREAYLYEADDESEGGILGQIGNTLKKTFTFDDDLDARPNYGYQAGNWGNWDDDWDYDRRGGQPGYGGSPSYGNQPSYGSNRPAYDSYAAPGSGYDRSGTANYDRPGYGSTGYDNRSGAADQRSGQGGYGSPDYGSTGYDNRPGINDNPGYGRRGYQDRATGQDYGGQEAGNQGYGNQGYGSPGSGQSGSGYNQSGYDNSSAGRSYDDQGYDRGYGDRDYGRSAGSSGPSGYDDRSGYGGSDYADRSYGAPTQDRPRDNRPGASGYGRPLAPPAPTIAALAVPATVATIARRTILAQTIPPAVPNARVWAMPRPAAIAPVAPPPNPSGMRMIPGHRPVAPKPISPRPAAPRQPLQNFLNLALPPTTGTMCPAAVPPRPASPIRTMAATGMSRMNGARQNAPRAMLSAAQLPRQGQKA